MSWLQRVFRSNPRSQTAEPEDFKIPAIKFDPSLVTKTVERDIKESISVVPEFNRTSAKIILPIAILAAREGGNLFRLNEGIKELRLNSVDNNRSAEICRFIHFRATAMIRRDRALACGLTQGVWLYSGAPCMLNAKKPDELSLRQDACHKMANGTTYNLKDGMLLDGKWTYPGREWGCRCASKVSVPGFD